LLYDLADNIDRIEVIYGVNLTPTPSQTNSRQNPLQAKQTSSKTNSKQTNSKQNQLQVKPKENLQLRPLLYDSVTSHTISTYVTMQPLQQPASGVSAPAVPDGRGDGWACAEVWVPEPEPDGPAGGHGGGRGCSI